MSGRARTRGTNRTPAKGTKGRALILLMLRPQGVTATEAAAQGTVGDQRQFNARLNEMRNFGGWDIRSFPVPNDSGKPRKALCSAYRIVGRNLDGGGYRSLLRVDKNVLDT